MDHLNKSEKAILQDIKQKEGKEEQQEEDIEQQKTHNEIFQNKDNSMTEQSSKRKGKRRILAVDDNPDITLTLEEALKDDGSFEIDTFNDPELALSSFKPGLYDLALLDFKMPKCMDTSYTIR